MRELSLFPSYVFWTGISYLLAIILQDSSSYSLHVLNLNLNFLPQFAHTQKNHRGILILYLKVEVKLKNGNLGAWPRPVLGCTGCAAGCPAQLWCRWESAQADICLQASLKNVLFSAGPNALFDHGQNIYGCWASYLVWLHSPPSKAGLGPQPREINEIINALLELNPRRIKTHTHNKMISLLITL